MKTKRLLLVLACLLLLAERGYTQPTDTPQNNPAQQSQDSPWMQEINKAVTRSGIRAFWDGYAVSGAALGLLHDPERRAMWGISDEQSQQILDYHANSPARMQEISSGFSDELQAVFNRNDPFMWNADAETLKIFGDIQDRIASENWRITAEAMENILTPEQIQMTREAYLANIGEMPIASIEIFEVLNLTDAQREQMAEIKRMLEPEFERNLEIFVSNSMTLARIMDEELDRQGIVHVGLIQDEESMKRFNEYAERMRIVRARLMTENQEFMRLSDEIQSSGRAFATQFKTQMFDVLTDEQWMRLQELIDNPPEHALLFRQRQRESSGETEDNKRDIWVPGPDSWRPGMPIPESYRQQRNTQIRFPRPQH